MAYFMAKHRGQFIFTVEIRKYSPGNKDIGIRSGKGVDEGLISNGKGVVSTSMGCSSQHTLPHFGDVVLPRVVRIDNFLFNEFVIDVRTWPSGCGSCKSHSTARYKRRSKTSNAFLERGYLAAMTTHSKLLQSLI